MALSAASRAHRADLDELARLAGQDLSLIFSDTSSAVRVRDELMDTLPRLMETYGSASASLAADRYDDLRDQAGARGRFRAIVAELPDRGRTDSLARWAVEPLFGSRLDGGSTALTKATGGLQRIIFDAARDTMATSSLEDREAEGWLRIGQGECDWCQQYIDGEVRTIGGYDFPAHDFCRCDVEPVFD